MIPKYDAIEQSVRLNEPKLKGKVGQNAVPPNLSMNLVIEKNKKIDQDNRLQKVKVIRARKLRIKISELFNKKIQKNGSVLVNTSVNRGHLTSSHLQLASQKRTQSFSTMSQKRLYNSFKTLKSLRKSEKKQLRFSFPNSKAKQQTGGMINLFQKFSEQEINQIQSDQSYFLVSPELIELFRKYMTKKRMNNKDYSYQHFMLRKRRETAQNIGNKWDEMSPDQMKKYVLARIGFTPSHEKASRSHLLTNPLSIQLHRSKRDKTQHKSQHHRVSLFQQLKRRQMQNQRRLTTEQAKKLRKLRIDIFYNDGVATEVRAIQLDKRKHRLSERNTLQSRRSIDYRNQIAFVNNNYGKSVELAEQVRNQFIKNRQNKQKEAQK